MRLARSLQSRQVRFATPFPPPAMRAKVATAMRSHVSNRPRDITIRFLRPSHSPACYARKANSPQRIASATVLGLERYAFRVME